MNICIVLLGANKNPIGGYKIMYEYANRLIEEGHAVSILFLNDTQFKKYHFPEHLRKIIVNIYTYIEPRWFKLDKNIKKISNMNSNYKKILNGVDICIATASKTVGVVNNLFPKAKKMYYIQDYESWETKEEELKKTYSLEMDNIVVSRWLKDIVDLYSLKPSTLIRNPIDINIYKVHNPIENRNKYTIGILYHKAPMKGFYYAFEALKILKNKYPQLKVLMFGTPSKPHNMPKWFKYVKKASQEETVDIYNNISIFMCASIKEGYGLTGAESMACGAAFVSTAYDSVFEYAENNKNALLSPVCDIEALVKNVSKLIEDDSLRIKIAYAGVNSMKEYSWEKAMNEINKLIESS